MEKEKIIKLISEAIKIRERAYAKYSDFKVGAVVIGGSGEKYFGVNVENSSYGLSNCAERAAIFNAITNGEKSIDILIVVGEKLISPCGACRQVIAEFSNENTKIIMANIKHEFNIVKIEELLPMAFKLDENKK